MRTWYPIFSPRSQTWCFSGLTSIYAMLTPTWMLLGYATCAQPQSQVVTCLRGILCRSNLSLCKGLSSLAHFLLWLLRGADLFLSLDFEFCILLLSCGTLESTTQWRLSAIKVKLELELGVWATLDRTRNETWSNISTHIRKARMVGVYVNKLHKGFTINP